MAPSSLSPSARRERVRACKDAFPPMGVYAVRNLVNGRVLVGASRNVDSALQRLQFELRMRGCRNVDLMADWLAHGPGQFTFEVLARVKPPDDPAFDAEAELEDLLQVWQFELGCRGPQGYNAASGGVA